MNRQGTDGAGGERFWYQAPPYGIEVVCAPGPEAQRLLAPDLEHLQARAFLDDKIFNAIELPQFLGMDLHLRVHDDAGLAGVFVADFMRVAGRPVCYLAVGLVEPHRRSGGRIMPLTMGLTLELAGQAFGTDEFFVALRTANPRVMAKLWACSWVRFYPRRDWAKDDPRLAPIMTHFLDSHFAVEHSDASGRVHYGIYHVTPWHGRIPWHHDESVNRFWREHLGPEGHDAIMFLGPTLPPMQGLVQGQVSWPGGPR